MFLKGSYKRNVFTQHVTFKKMFIKKQVFLKIFCWQQQYYNNIMATDYVCVTATLPQA